MGGGGGGGFWLEGHGSLASLLFSLPSFFFSLGLFLSLLSRFLLDRPWRRAAAETESWVHVALYFLWRTPKGRRRSHCDREKKGIAKRESGRCGASVYLFPPQSPSFRSVGWLWL